MGEWRRSEPLINFGSIINPVNLTYTFNRDMLQIQGPQKLSIAAWTMWCKSSHIQSLNSYEGLSWGVYFSPKDHDDAFICESGNHREFKAISVTMISDHKWHHMGSAILIYLVVVPWVGLRQQWKVKCCCQTSNLHVPWTAMMSGTRITVCLDRGIYA